MSTGTDLLGDANVKLDWATSRLEEIHRIFAEFAHPGGGDQRPFGITFRELARPEGLVVATFIAEQPMPVEISTLAADLVHNTRVALDHVLARLKNSFGGDTGKGYFPICQYEDDWQERVVNAGRRNPLRGLAEPAVALIYAEQPLHRDPPGDDPLVTLNDLDNADKHRLLHAAFVYPGHPRGLDLIEVLFPRRVITATNLWGAPEELLHGTKLARFMVRGPANEVLSVRSDAQIGPATGDRDAGRTTYIEMIERVRAVVAKAITLVDSH